MKGMIICAAITGAIVSKSKNSNLPITPEEIINEAYECYRAGAAIVHIHVRDEEGNPSLSYELYKYVIEGIRKKCNIIIGISTSNFGLDIDDEKRYKLYDLDIEIASLAFGNLRRENGAIINSDIFLYKSMEIMKEKRILPEIEIFNNEMYHKVKQYYKSNLAGEVPYIQYIFGSPGGMNASKENILACIENTDDRWRWSAAGIGKMQLYTNIVSFLKGATTIRTGMEDNVYFSHGIKAKSSAQLVKRLAHIITCMGTPIATPDMARNILNLKACYDISS